MRGALFGMAQAASGGGLTMRLIDGDALKTKAIRCETFKLYDAPVFLKAVGTKEIDRAPTIDAVPVSELKKLRDYLYAEDLIFMRGLAELNKLIANYGAKRYEEVSE